MNHNQLINAKNIKLYSITIRTLAIVVAVAAVATVAVETSAIVPRNITKKKRITNNN